MSIIRAAYAASFVKLVSRVAYLGSRRSDNQRSVRNHLFWPARFVFRNSVSAPLGVVWKRLGTVWIVLERIVSVWSRFGTVVNICVVFSSVSGAH